MSSRFAHRTEDSAHASRVEDQTPYNKVAQTMPDSGPNNIQLTMTEDQAVCLEHRLSEIELGSIHWIEVEPLHQLLRHVREQIKQTESSQ